MLRHQDKMDFNSLIAELRTSSENLPKDSVDRSLLSSVYCNKACKVLDEVAECTDYDTIITGLWLVTAHFAEQLAYLKPVPALSELCFKLFRQCAKAVLNIQWQNLEEDSSLRQNFLASLANLHVKLVPFDFPRFRLLEALTENPWTNPTLAKVMGGEVEDSDKDEVRTYIEQEDPIILQLRVDMMLQENCEEYALNLCNNCLSHPELQSDLGVRKTQLSLLYKLGHEDKLQEECQKLNIQDAVRIIKQLQTSETHRQICTVLAQTFMVQNWIRPSDMEANKELLRLWIRHQLLVDREQDQFKESVWAMAKLSQSTEQIVIFIDVLREECGEIFLQLFVDMCIFAINVDKGQMETNKKEGNMEAAAARRSDMASICAKLSCLCHHASVKVARICALTSFALKPTEQSFAKIGTFYGQGTDCCNKCGRDRNREPGTINPATLYEVERLLNMLRPDYLSPDQSYINIQILCRRFLQESLKNAQQLQRQQMVAQNSGITTLIDGAVNKITATANRPTNVFEALSPQDYHNTQMLLNRMRIQNITQVKPAMPGSPAAQHRYKAGSSGVVQQGDLASSSLAGQANKAQYMFDVEKIKSKQPYGVPVEQQHQYYLMKHEKELEQRRKNAQKKREEKTQQGMTSNSQVQQRLWQQQQNQQYPKQQQHDEQVSEMIQTALQDSNTLQELTENASPGIVQAVINIMKGTIIKPPNSSDIQQQAGSQQMKPIVSTSQQGTRPLPTVSTLLKPSAQAQQIQQQQNQEHLHAKQQQSLHPREQSPPRRHPRPQLYAQPIVVSTASSVAPQRYQSSTISVGKTNDSSAVTSDISPGRKQKGEGFVLAKSHVEDIRRFMQTQMSNLQQKQFAEPRQMSGSTVTQKNTPLVNTSFSLINRPKTTVELAEQAALAKLPKHDSSKPDMFQQSQQLNSNSRQMFTPQPKPALPKSNQQQHFTPSISRADNMPHHQAELQHQQKLLQSHHQQANTFSFPSSPNSNVLPNQLLPSDELSGSIMGIDDTIIKELLQDSGILANTFPDIEVETIGEDKSKSILPQSVMPPVSTHMPKSSNSQLYSYMNPLASQTPYAAQGLPASQRSVEANPIITTSQHQKAASASHQPPARAMNKYSLLSRVPCSVSHPGLNTTLSPSISQLGDRASGSQQSWSDTKSNACSNLKENMGLFYNKKEIKEELKPTVDQLRELMKKEDIEGEVCMDASNNATYRCIICSNAFESLDHLREHVRNVCKPGLQSSSVYNTKIKQDRANSAKAGVETTTVFQCLRCFELCVSDAGIKQHRLTCKRVPTVPSDLKKDNVNSKQKALLKSAITKQPQKKVEKDSPDMGPEPPASFPYPYPSLNAEAVLKSMTLAGSFISQSSESSVGSKQQAPASSSTLINKSTAAISTPLPNILSNATAVVSTTLSVSSSTTSCLTATSQSQLSSLSVNIVIQTPICSTNITTSCTSSAKDMLVLPDNPVETVTNNASAIERDLETTDAKLVTKEDPEPIPQPNFTEITGSGGSKFYKCRLCSQTLCSHESFLVHWKECSVKNKNLIKKLELQEKACSAIPVSGEVLENLVRVIADVASGGGSIPETISLDSEFSDVGDYYCLRDPCKAGLLDMGESSDFFDSDFWYDSADSNSEENMSEAGTETGDTGDGSATGSGFTDNMDVSKDGENVQEKDTDEGTIEEEDVTGTDQVKRKHLDDTDNEGRNEGESEQSYVSTRKAPPKLRDRKTLKPIQSFINETFISPFAKTGKMTSARSVEKLKDETGEDKAKQPSGSEAESDGESLYCKVCRTSFQTKRILLQHFAGKHLQPYTVRTVADSSSYFCHLCQKTYSTFMHYMQHVPNHSVTIYEKMKAFIASRKSQRSQRIAIQRGLAKKGNMSPKMAKALKSKKAATKSAVDRLKQQLLAGKTQAVRERLRISKRKRSLQSAFTSSEDDFSSDASNNVVFKSKKSESENREPTATSKPKRSANQTHHVEHANSPQSSFEQSEEDESDDQGSRLARDHDDDYVLSEETDSDSDSMDSITPPTTRSSRRIALSLGLLDTKAEKQTENLKLNEGIVEQRENNAGGLKCLPDTLVADCDADSNCSDLLLECQNGHFVPSESKLETPSRSQETSSIAEDTKVAESIRESIPGRTLIVRSLSKQQKERLKSCDLQPTVLLETLHVDVVLPHRQEVISPMSTIKRQEVGSPVETIKIPGVSSPVETVKIQEVSSPVEIVKIQEVSSPVETVKVQEVSSPVETEKVQEVSSPVETVKVQEVSSPVGTVKRKVNSSVKTVKVQEVSSPVETVKVQEVSSPVGTVKRKVNSSVKTVKVQEVSSPVETVKVQEVSSPVETVKVQEFSSHVGTVKRKVNSSVKTVKVQEVSSPVETVNVQEVSSPVETIKIQEVSSPVETVKAQEVSSPVGTVKRKDNSSVKTVKIQKVISPVEIVKVQEVSSPGETVKVQEVNSSVGTVERKEVISPLKTVKVPEILSLVETVKVQKVSSPVGTVKRKVNSSVKTVKVEKVSSPVETVKLQEVRSPVGTVKRCEVIPPVDNLKQPEVISPMETVKVHEDCSPVDTINQRVDVPNEHFEHEPAQQGDNPTQNETSTCVPVKAKNSSFLDSFLSYLNQYPSHSNIEQVERKSTTTPKLEEEVVEKKVRKRSRSGPPRVRGFRKRRRSIDFSQLSESDQGHGSFRQTGSLQLDTAQSVSESEAGSSRTRRYSSHSLQDSVRGSLSKFPTQPCSVNLGRKLSLEELSANRDLFSASQKVTPDKPTIVTALAGLKKVTTTMDSASSLSLPEEKQSCISLMPSGKGNVSATKSIIVAPENVFMSVTAESKPAKHKKHNGAEDAKVVLAKDRTNSGYFVAYTDSKSSHLGAAMQSHLSSRLTSEHFTSKHQIKLPGSICSKLGTRRESFQSKFEESALKDSLYYGMLEMVTDTLTSSEIRSPKPRLSDIESSDLVSIDIMSSEMESSDLGFLEPKDTESSDHESTDVRSLDIGSALIISSEKQFSDFEAIDPRSSDLKPSDMECWDHGSADIGCSDQEAADRHSFNNQELSNPEYLGNPGFQSENQSPETDQHEMIKKLAICLHGDSSVEIVENMEDVFQDKALQCGNVHSTGFMNERTVMVPDMFYCRNVHCSVISRASEVCSEMAENVVINLIEDDEIAESDTAATCPADMCSEMAENVVINLIEDDEVAESDTAAIYPADLCSEMAENVVINLIEDDEVAESDTAATCPVDVPCIGTDKVSQTDCIVDDKNACGIHSTPAVQARESQDPFMCVREETSVGVMSSLGEIEHQSSVIVVSAEVHSSSQPQEVHQELHGQSHEYDTIDHKEKHGASQGDPSYCDSECAELIQEPEEEMKAGHGHSIEKLEAQKVKGSLEEEGVVEESARSLCDTFKSDEKLMGDVAQVSDVPLVMVVDSGKVMICDKVDKNIIDADAHGDQHDSLESCSIAVVQSSEDMNLITSDQQFALESCSTPIVQSSEHTNSDTSDRQAAFETCSTPIVQSSEHTNSGTSDRQTALESCSTSIVKSPEHMNSDTPDQQAALESCSTPIVKSPEHMNSDTPDRQAALESCSTPIVQSSEHTNSDTPDRQAALESCSTPIVKSPEHMDSDTPDKQAALESYSTPIVKSPEHMDSDTPDQQAALESCSTPIVQSPEHMDSDTPDQQAALESCSTSIVQSPEHMDSDTPDQQAALESCSTPIVNSPEHMNSETEQQAALESCSTRVVQYSATIDQESALEMCSTPFVQSSEKNDSSTSDHEDVLESCSAPIVKSSESMDSATSDKEGVLGSFSSPIVKSSKNMYSDISDQEFDFESNSTPVVQFSESMYSDISENGSITFSITSGQGEDNTELAVEVHENDQGGDKMPLAGDTDKAAPFTERAVDGEEEMKALLMENNYIRMVNISREQIIVECTSDDMCIDTSRTSATAGSSTPSRDKSMKSSSVVAPSYVSSIPNTAASSLKPCEESLQSYSSKERKPDYHTRANLNPNISLAAFIAERLTKEDLEPAGEYRGNANDRANLNPNISLAAFIAERLTKEDLEPAGEYRRNANDRASFRLIGQDSPLDICSHRMEATEVSCAGNISPLISYADLTGCMEATCSGDNKLSINTGHCIENSMSISHCGLEMVSSSYVTSVGSPSRNIYHSRKEPLELAYFSPISVNIGGDIKELARPTCCEPLDKSCELDIADNMKSTNVMFSAGLVDYSSSEDEEEISTNCDNHQKEVSTKHNDHAKDGHCREDPNTKCDNHKEKINIKCDDHTIVGNNIISLQNSNESNDLWDSNISHEVITASLTSDPHQVLQTDRVSNVHSACTLTAQEQTPYGDRIEDQTWTSNQDKELAEQQPALNASQSKDLGLLGTMAENNSAVHDSQMECGQMASAEGVVSEDSSKRHKLLVECTVQGEDNSQAFSQMLGHVSKNVTEDLSQDILFCEKEENSSQDVSVCARKENLSQDTPVCVNSKNLSIDLCVNSVDSQNACPVASSQNNDNLAVGTGCIQRGLSQVGTLKENYKEGRICGSDNSGDYLACATASQCHFVSSVDQLNGPDKSAAGAYGHCQLMEHSGDASVGPSESTSFQGFEQCEMVTELQEHSSSEKRVVEDGLVISSLSRRSHTGIQSNTGMEPSDTQSALPHSNTVKENVERQVVGVALRETKEHLAEEPVACEATHCVLSKADLERDVSHVVPEKAGRKSENNVDIVKGVTSCSEAAKVNVERNVCHLLPEGGCEVFRDNGHGNSFDIQSQRNNQEKPGEHERSGAELENVSSENHALVIEFDSYQREELSEEEVQLLSPICMDREVVKGEGVCAIKVNYAAQVILSRCDAPAYNSDTGSECESPIRTSRECSVLAPGVCERKRPASGVTCSAALVHQASLCQSDVANNQGVISCSDAITQPGNNTDNKALFGTVGNSQSCFQNRGSKCLKAISGTCVSVMEASNQVFQKLDADLASVPELKVGTHMEQKMASVGSIIAANLVDNGSLSRLCAENTAGVEDRSSCVDDTSLKAESDILKHNVQISKCVNPVVKHAAIDKGHNQLREPSSITSSEMFACSKVDAHFKQLDCKIQSDTSCYTGNDSQVEVSNKSDGTYEKTDAPCETRLQSVELGNVATANDSVAGKSTDGESSRPDSSKERTNTDHETDDGDDLSDFDLIIEKDTSYRNLVSFPISLEKRSHSHVQHSTCPYVSKGSITYLPPSAKSSVLASGFTYRKIPTAESHHSLQGQQVGFTCSKPLITAKTFRKSHRQFVWEIDDDNISGANTPEPSAAVVALASSFATRHTVSASEAASDPSLDTLRRKQKALREKSETAPFTWDLDDTAESLVCHNRSTNKARRPAKTNSDIIRFDKSSLGKNVTMQGNKVQQIIPNKRPLTPDVSPGKMPAKFRRTFSVDRQAKSSGSSTRKELKRRGDVVVNEVSKANSVKSQISTSDSITIDKEVSFKKDSFSPPVKLALSTDGPSIQTGVICASSHEVKGKRRERAQKQSHFPLPLNIVLQDCRTEISSLSAEEDSLKHQLGLRSRHSSVESNKSDKSVNTKRAVDNNSPSPSKRSRKSEEDPLSPKLKKIGLIKITKDSLSPPASTSLDSTAPMTRSSEAAIKAFHQKSLRSRGVNPCPLAAVSPTATPKHGAQTAHPKTSPEISTRLKSSVSLQKLSSPLTITLRHSGAESKIEFSPKSSVRKSHDIASMAGAVVKRRSSPVSSPGASHIKTPVALRSRKGPAEFSKHGQPSINPSVVRVKPLPSVALTQGASRSHAVFIKEIKSLQEPLTINMVSEPKKHSSKRSWRISKETKLSQGRKQLR